MLLLLTCPNCKDAYERDTRDYRTARMCQDCGALLLIDWEIQPHLVLKCRACGSVFEVQPAPGMRPVCPQCGLEPGWPAEPTA